MKRSSVLSAAILLLGFLIWTVELRAQEAPSSDIRHYELNIQPDFARRQVRIICTIWIDNPNHSETFSFGLSDQYHVNSVAAGNTRAEVERSSGKIQVKVIPQEKIRLVFDLESSSAKSDDEKRNVVEDESLFLLWSDRFYPISFDDWATVKTTIVLPAGFQAIAPGKLLRKRRMGSSVEYVFASSKPTVCFSVFADSRWIRTVHEKNGIRMQTLLHAESQKFAEQIFSTSSDVLQFFSEWFGRYPAEQFSFVTLTGMYARRAFPGFVGYEPKYLEREMTTTGHDAHETSLLWWGYTVRGRGHGSGQWTEGFGDYAEVLYDKARQKALPQIFQFFRNEYLKLPAEKDLTYAELRGNTPQPIVHGKFPWLMQVVRYLVGEEALRKGFALLFQRYRYRTFSMDEFVATLEEGTGQSLHLWREQWLERKGVPVMALRYSYEDGVVRGTIEQRGQLYDLPVEIGIGTGKGMRIETVRVKEQKQTFSFPSAEKPSRITLDPNGWLLMKTIYEEPAQPK